MLNYDSHSEYIFIIPVPKTNVLSTVINFNTNFRKISTLVLP